MEQRNFHQTTGNLLWRPWELPTVNLSALNHFIIMEDKKYHHPSMLFMQPPLAYLNNNDNISTMSLQSRSYHQSNLRSENMGSFGPTCQVTTRDLLNYFPSALPAARTHDTPRRGNLQNFKCPLPIDLSTGTAISKSVAVASITSEKKQPSLDTSSIPSLSVHQSTLSTLAAAKPLTLEEIGGIAGINPATRQLKISLKTPLSERPFKCSYCPDKFTKFPHLRSHIMAKHTYERPFICGICGHKFAQRSNLRKHSRIHTDQYPLKCPICPSSFRLECTLGSHITKIHSFSNQEIARKYGA